MAGLRLVPEPEEAMRAAALLFPGNELLQAIMAQAGKPPRVRFREAEQVLDIQEEHGLT